MEWIFLILILAFIIWTIQLLMVYRKQVEKIDAQIHMAQSNQAEVTEQAERYEARAQELAGELADIKGEIDSLEKTEKGLEREVGQLGQQSSARRPTRHKVEPQDDSSE
ncbi:MAG: hypothetical protein QGG64_16500 [Candidatus Latescibacteria bacterium]|nr:hypothetical protein [Candidatus Latescibacterota bacterium]